MPQGADSAKAAQAVDVAAAVLIRPDGAVLLARRPAGKVYAGYWEFPGGKVEPGEGVPDALSRELKEELGIDTVHAYPWITRVFTYPHATVRLHFYRVTAWNGVLTPHEHDGLAWCDPRAAHLSVAPILPANGPVLRGLALPSEYALSRVSALGEAAWLRALETRLRQGLRLVQLREPDLPAGRLEALAHEAVRRVHAAGARLLISRDIELARKVQADGVHLSASQLSTLDARPDFDLVGASCHNAQELRLAERLGADFAVLGSVRETPTHPGQQPLGWEGFEREARGASIPVYALGGVGPDDLERAWRHGAHGIAMLRGAWPG